MTSGLYGEYPPVVTLGLHPGLGRDPCGLCVVEIQDRVGSETKVGGRHFIVRHLERLPPKTKVRTLADRLQEVVAGVRPRTQELLPVCVNATGHGTPVVDRLVRGLAECWPWTVYFNHGDQRTKDGSTIHLGKAWLVTRLKVFLEEGQIHLPRTPEAEILAEELNDYELPVPPDADRYGAVRVGTRDELVTALGMAVQVETGGWSVW